MAIFLSNEKYKGGSTVGTPQMEEILMSFSIPRTPREVEQELGIKKLKMERFVGKGVIEPLNPLARKGKLFICTRKAQKQRGLRSFEKVGKRHWNLIGWIWASPRQRLVVMRATDSSKRASEEIRERASRTNPNLTRISTKGILRELVAKGLVKTELVGRKRYYWISAKGRLILKDLDGLWRNEK